MDFNLAEHGLQNDFTVGALSAAGGVDLAAGAEGSFALLASVLDFDVSFTALVDALLSLEEESGAAGVAGFVVLAGLALLGALVAVLKDSGALDVFDPEAVLVSALFDAGGVDSERTELTLVAFSGVSSAFSAVFVGTGDANSISNSLMESFSAGLDAGLGVVKILEEVGGLAFIAGIGVGAGEAVGNALLASLDTGDVLDEESSTAVFNARVIFQDVTSSFIALDAGSGVRSEALVAASSAFLALLVVDKGESKSTVLNALASLEEVSGGAGFAVVLIGAVDAHGGALLAVSEVEQEESSGALAFADAVFEVEFGLAVEALLGRAGFAVGVLAGGALAVELEVSGGAVGVALFLEKEVVGLADIAGLFSGAGGAVVNALDAFSVLDEAADGALLDALVLVVKEETLLANDALVEVLLVALAAFLVGLAEHALVVLDSLDGAFGAVVDAFAVNTEDFTLVAVFAGLAVGAFLAERTASLASSSDVVGEEAFLALGDTGVLLGVEVKRGLAGEAGSGSALGAVLVVFAGGAGDASVVLTSVSFSAFTGADSEVEEESVLAFSAGGFVLAV